MNFTVFGIFETREDAEDAIRSLDNRGYESKDISIVMKDKSEGEQVEKHTGAKVTGGAVSGATTGAVVGGIAGLVASFVIPGLGAFFIGGPIAAALGLGGAAATTVSGAATGAVAGGLLGALGGLGLSEKDARDYEERVKAGGILVAVPARTDEEREVERILTDANADSVKSVSMPAQREERYTERYSEPSQASQMYAGAKGGRTSTKKGKGWHGDSGGHAKAGKGKDVPGKGRGK